MCGCKDIPVVRRSGLVAAHCFNFMILRTYQQACLSGNAKAFEEFDRVLDVIPTGGGKTIIFSNEAQRRNESGERVLILAHREELIDQAIAKLHVATGIRAEKEKAEFSATLEASVVVASIQTMTRRLDKWPADHFGLVVCDEAHHALSASWQTVLNHFTGDQVLGVTATPDRGDKKNLGTYFQTIGFEISLFDLIEQGYLSRITLKSIPLKIDLTTVGSMGGDFKDADLGSAIEPYLDQIAQSIKEQAGQRRTLAFLPLIATSKKFVEACAKVGLKAGHVDGTSENRREILDAFANDDFQILSNAMLLTEGYDVDSEPTGIGIDCVVVLRPTRSRPLYAQMVGRGTRIATFKDNLLLLDFLWHHERHSIARPAHLIAKSDADAEQITKLTQLKAAMPSDVIEELDLEDVAVEAASQREEALKKKLEENKNREARTMSAEEFAMEHNSMETAEYSETMPWESAPVTEKQMKWLKRAKIDLATVRSKGHASKLLGLHFGSKKPTLASESQRQLMQRMGHANAHEATADEARKFFSTIRQPKQEALL